MFENLFQIYHTIFKTRITLVHQFYSIYLQKYNITIYLYSILQDYVNSDLNWVKIRHHK